MLGCASSCESGLQPWQTCEKESVRSGHGGGAGARNAVLLSAETWTGCRDKLNLITVDMILGPRMIATTAAAAAAAAAAVAVGYRE